MVTMMNFRVSQQHEITITVKHPHTSEVIAYKLNLLWSQQSPQSLSPHLVQLFSLFYLFTYFSRHSFINQAGLSFTYRMLFVRYIYSALVNILHRFRSSELHSILFVSVPYCIFGTTLPHILRESLHILRVVNACFPVINGTFFCCVYEKCTYAQFRKTSTRRVGCGYEQVCKSICVHLTDYLTC